MPSSLLKESQTDCLIIGAGPAGLFCANGLAKAGVKVRIIDKRPEKITVGHADGIQPRTIEVFQSYGLADRLLKEANQLHTAAFYNPGSSGEIQLTERCPAVTAPTARYPFKLTLHQGAIESILGDSLQSAHVQVDRPMEPMSLRVTDVEAELDNAFSYPVKVILKNLAAQEGQPDTEIVRARFVIGADGAHSWVRNALNIDMIGEQTSYAWGVVDLEPETDFPDIRNWCGIHSHNGSCMIIPREGEKVRLYIQLEDGHEGILNSEGRVDKAKMTPQKLLAIAQKILYPYTLRAKSGFEWWTIYRIGQRVATSFSHRNRVFIVGDACHTHSPKAGQGMNASMNDSHNLIWKLAHVLKGKARMEILSTYEFERRQYAQNLIDFDKKFSVLFSGKPRTDANSNGVSHEEFIRIYQTFGGFSSGIGVRYHHSVIVDLTHQQITRKLTIGERMPPQILIRAADSRPVELQDLLPSDIRFKILVFIGNADDDAQFRRVQGLASALDFLHRYSTSEICDVIIIGTASTGENICTKVAGFLQCHWSKILVDDKDILGQQGGNAYENFGIGQQGAVVVIRPDGYVGMVAPYDRIRDMGTYFSGFLA